MQVHAESKQPVLITRPECAAAIRVSVRKLDEMVKNRDIPSFKLRGKILFRLDRVLSALDALERQEAHRV